MKKGKKILFMVLVFTISTIISMNTSALRNDSEQQVKAADTYSAYSANQIYNTGTTTKNKKYVALTFDDGPNTTTTTQVLDKLEQYKIPATFFLIGNSINDATKTVMKRQLSLGCEIASHSYTHSYMTNLTKAQIVDEMNKTSNTIYNAVGVRPAFFRPPYIATNNTMYEAIDLPFINGINCSDWESSVSAEKRASTILNNVKDGDIILLHDMSGNINTVQALDSMFKGLQDKGFTPVTVSELFKVKGINPNIENKIWTNVLK